jgi:hypothetical protein
MLGALFVLLAHYIHDASWLIIYLACVLGVFVALIVIVALATIFDSKRDANTRIKVLDTLCRYFGFRRGKTR